jgi:hypothetical protein
LKGRHRVIIFDDLQEARKDTINAIVRLSRKHSIIAGSEKEVERLKFDFETVKLERLDRKSSIELAKKLKLKDDVAEKVASKSSGLPDRKSVV